MLVLRPNEFLAAYKQSRWVWPYLCDKSLVIAQKTVTVRVMTTMVDCLSVMLQQTTTARYLTQES